MCINEMLVPSLRNYRLQASISNSNVHVQPNPLLFAADVQPVLIWLSEIIVTSLKTH